jgi:hypothetical protein
MNQSVKIGVTVLGIAIALYAAFIIGKTSVDETAQQENLAPVATSTTATTTANAPTSPTVSQKPKVAPRPTPGSALVQIKYYGGLCLNGKICSTTKMITKDAVYFKDGVRVSNVNKNDVAKITDSMNRVNWQTLRSKPKAGGCDTTRVQEITYTFYTKNGVQSISNCQYDFDVTMDPFRTIAITLPQ